MKRRKIPIHAQTNRSGSISYVVRLGIDPVTNKAVRKSFKTRSEAITARSLWEVAQRNEAGAAFALPLDKRQDALKALEIVGTDVSLLEAARYYRSHVLVFKTAPTIAALVERYVKEGKTLGNRPTTVKDKEGRLKFFADDFGKRRLCDLGVEEIKDWLNDDEWGARSRINYRTKISQLYNYAIKHRWVDSNIAELIDNPTVDETTPHPFTLAESELLLKHAPDCALLPYIALGLFAGIRVAELGRLDVKDIHFGTDTIRIGPGVAKTRAQRNIDMQPALKAFLEPMRDDLEADAVIVGEKHRLNMEKLVESIRVDMPEFEWKPNGLRHAFATYHYAMFDSADKTSAAMGNSSDVMRRFYKGLVTKNEAENFWNLRP